MSRGPDASTVLQRALLRAAQAAGCTIAFPAAHMTRWASATFTGAQHQLTLAGLDDYPLQAWLGGLGDADIVLRGHILADIAVLAVTRQDGHALVGIEALTVEA